MNKNALDIMSGAIWAAEADVRTGPAENVDHSLTAGAYELRAACVGGAVKLAVAPGGPSQIISCSGGVGPGLNVCLKRPGLSTKISLAAGEPKDVVWGLYKVVRSNCVR